MWKPEHRRVAERRGLRYPKDLTDAEWALITCRLKHSGKSLVFDGVAQERFVARSFGFVKDDLSAL
jgi:hypothetical protein